MPDISKLSELCGILDISFEQLPGSEQQAQKVQKVMEYAENGSGQNPSFAEIGDVAPLMPPKTLSKIAENIEVDLNGLIGLAPFADKKILQQLL